MKLRVNSKIELSTDRVLEKRGLGSSSKLAKVMASEVKRLSDPYVPMQQGTLKNTAQVVETSDGVALVYEQPYAHYQYYGEVMAGRAPKQYTGAAIKHHGAPIRGANWEKRMMADRGDEVTRVVAKYVGGKIK